MREFPMVKMGSLLKKKPEYGANASAIEFDGNNPRYLRITDIGENGELLNTDIKAIDSHIAYPYKLAQNDIVIARTGNTVGKSLIYKSRYGDIAYAGYLIRFCFDEELTSPDFIIQVLHSPAYESWIGETIRTGAQPNINALEYCELKIPKIGIQEQQKIARILTTVDNLIEKTQALIDKYTAVKQGMMHDLFTRGIDLATGQLRPSYQQAPQLYKETELGWVPREWNYTNLGDYIDKYLYGPRFDASLYDVGGNVKTIRGTDFTKDGDVLYEQVPVAKIPDAKIRHHILKGGDLVIVTTADCGLTAVFEKQGYDFIPSAYAVKLKLKETVDPFYLKAFMQTHFATTQVNKFVRQGTLGNLPGSDILNFVIAMPEKAEQVSIFKRLHSIDRLIKQEKKCLSKMQTKKKGLMQDLLTGRVRVNV